MQRTILTYGLIAGPFIILGMIGTLLLPAHLQKHCLWLGYLIMLIGLSAVLLAIKTHRDKALGGVIKFWPAFLVGLGVVAIASVAYVATWEVYLAMTHYRFMDEFTAQALEAKRAAGVTGPAYDKAVVEMATMKANYAKLWYRLPMTFAEIFPVGLLVALVSAALLRNPKFLPARA